MKRVLSLILALVMTLSLCMAVAEEVIEFDPETMVDLDGYILVDPEGVEYETRLALYRPVLPGEEEAEMGITDMYVIYYYTGTNGKAQVSIMVFENEEQAQAYLETAQNGEVDGNVYISVLGEEFFIAMAAFMPDVNDMIGNMMMSGFMEVE